MTDFIKSELDQSVLSLTIARPEKKNALTAGMYAALADEIEGAQLNPNVAVILLTGAGDVFTAGNDIADFAAIAERSKENAGKRNETRPAGRFLTALADNQKPLIAAVNGLAVGVGFTLLLHCDLVYAAESAVLIAPFVDLALIPEASSTLLLPAVVGSAKAAEILLLAEPVSAAEAERLGIVTRLFADAELRPEALARARRLAKKPRSAVAAARKLMRPDPALIKERIALEGEIFGNQLQSDEAKAVFTTFLQKKKS